MSDTEITDSAAEGNAPRRDSDRAENRGTGKIWLYVLAGVVLLLGLIAGADALASAGRIHPGVHVGPVAVGGKTVEAANKAITDFVTARSKAPVTVRAKDAEWQVTADGIGLSVDATSLAQGAFKVGRGDFANALSDRLRAVLGGVRLPLQLGYDTSAVAGLVDTINHQVATPAVDAGVRIEGTTVSRVEPKDGVGVSLEDAQKKIAGAFIGKDRSVDLTLGPLKPAIDTAGADQAYNTAQAMVSAPVTLYYNNKNWQVEPAAIGKWIDFRKSGSGSTAQLEAYVVADEVSSTVLPMVAEIGKPARDAHFTVSNGTVAIVPSEDGLQADAGELAKRLTTVLAGKSDRKAELTMHRVKPTLTTDGARAMGISQRLSTFTTNYGSGNKPRVNNIHTLADALDGTLVAPGGVFSFNKTIGPRTAAKGYQEANAIVNNKLVPQLGGGICQVGTTIFNTVFFSGLPVVERHNHSQYISHYPTGRDATVSWGGPDFKFKNDTANWVLIATAYTNSSITISLYGKDAGYKVSYDTGQWSNIVNPPIRQVPDPTLPAGSKVLEERGISGRTIVVVRHVTKNGTEIRTDSFKSVYKAAEEVIRVGTKAGSVVPTVTVP